MKWGVRRYQNEDGSLNAKGIARRDKNIKKVNSMYDHADKWTSRKIGKLDAKGKTAKANVMREMQRRNEQARKQKVDSLKKMNAEQFSKARRTDLKDTIFGGQMWMKRNSSSMTNPLSRFNEYQVQRGMRWASNFTLNSTLARMSPKEGYNYLDKKIVYGTGYNSK
jgi:hypothetical protein